ncbi:hypothetical protein V1517DRAFT_252756 [Lipomyces orientalis]|uniref:Uncharacterized protein n=1 Tax=Lipomyces orientalis TaxID=1233043 RepID=A0ACC3TXM6_9ASCO
MPGDRDLFPESPPGEHRTSAPGPSTTTKQVSVSLHDILAQSLHNLNLESAANHDRGQITTVPPPQPSSTSVPITCSTRPPPNHYPSLLSPSALRRPQQHAFIPQQSSLLTHEAQYLGTASTDPTNVPVPDRLLSTTRYPLNYSAQYPPRFASSSSRASLSSDGSSSMQSSMSSSASLSPPSSFASAAAAAAAAAASERDLFLQATQLDLRIPMLPDPSPMSDPAFFLVNGAGAQESPTDELAFPPALSSRHRSPRPRPQPIEQLGILATATAPACPAGRVGTATETPVALRVQFREEMLFGDGGCIDDEPFDEERPDNAHHRESQSSVASARESEYDADEDDDDDYFARGRTPSTIYDLPQAAAQVRQYDDHDALVLSPLSGVSRRELFPSINPDDD